MIFKNLLKVIKVFLLFTLCTVIFYYGMILINTEYENYHRYDEPQGTALKVFAQQNVQDSKAFKRLLLFYLNGE